LTRGFYFQNNFINFDYYEDKAPVDGVEKAMKVGIIPGNNVALAHCAVNFRICKASTGKIT
jgi:hypothetical protein